MKPANQFAVDAKRPATRESAAERLGATALVDCYRRLSGSGAHILDAVLQGSPPTQWEHYPADDAISRDRRYQWFYHSHSMADRPGSTEHGHFHLFARTEGGVDIDAATEKKFLAILGAKTSASSAHHLLCVGMSPVGVPISLFTVNRWVTGDQLLSASTTLRLLDSMNLETGCPMIDSVLMGLSRLYRPEIRSLLRRRDSALRTRAAAGPGTLDDVNVEVLSEVSLDIDNRIERVLRGGPGYLNNK